MLVSPSCGSVAEGLSSWSSASCSSEKLKRMPSRMTHDHEQRGSFATKFQFAQKLLMTSALDPIIQDELEGTIAPQPKLFSNLAML